jgi:hypothetical protein
VAFLLAAGGESAADGDRRKPANDARLRATRQQAELSVCDSQTVAPVTTPTFSLAIALETLKLSDSQTLKLSNSQTLKLSNSQTF